MTALFKGGVLGVEATAAVSGDGGAAASESDCVDVDVGDGAGLSAAVDAATIGAAGPKDA